MKKPFIAAVLTVAALFAVLSLAFPRSGTDALAAASIGAMFKP